MKKVLASIFVLVLTLVLSPLTVRGQRNADGAIRPDDGITVGVFYFPQYHADPRNEARYGLGWTEWETYKGATGRGVPPITSIPTPLWGYSNEADPGVFAQKIDAASSAHIDAFIFDWYWYDGPFLNQALEQGYSGAPNKDKVKYAIMWANHDWINYYSDTAETPIYHHYNSLAPNPPYRVKFWDGITPSQVDAMWDYLVSHYFGDPNYLKIDGKPYFILPDLQTFIPVMGGLAQAQASIAALQAKAIAAGLPGIHIGTLHNGIPETQFPNGNGLQAFGVSSVTSYFWATYAQRPTYQESLWAHLRFTNVMTRTYAAPYFPVVAVGWDVRSRQLQATGVGYPYGPIVTGSTPALFQDALEQTKQMLPNTGNRVLLINAWNEWTEGSYLEPDSLNGFGYLDAVRAVFE